MFPPGSTAGGSFGKLPDMRDHVRFFLNGREEIVRGPAAFLTVAEYLRDVRGMPGTKVVCAEGDCGACTVLVGRPAEKGLRYAAIDCCIQFVHQMDATHVVTVEGLQRNETLHPAQQAMVECHGSQCGYCTPGFVMALAGWTENGCQRERSRIALTGNLCRCTGYLPILDAADRLAKSPPARIAASVEPPGLVQAVEELSQDALRIVSDGHSLFAPTTLADAVAYKAAHPNAVIVAGATELGVLRNKRGVEPVEMLSVARVKELDGIKITPDEIIIGANASFAQIEETALDRLPQFRRIVERFGSPQIRHVATLAGNIANGSPIADSLPLLMVMEADMEIAGPGGFHRRRINGFYTGYKKKNLAGNEIIVRITLPLPAGNEMLRLYKSSRRTDLDIATFGAAIRVKLQGETIQSAAIAYSGVAATVVRMPETERFLAGRTFERSTFTEAGRLARREAQPITDVRGSADFRLQLCENVLTKFWFDERAIRREAAV